MNRESIMNKRCIGCGLTLQDSNNKTPGYTPNLKNAYCTRCFKLKNYGEKNYNEEIDPTKIINQVNKGQGLAFFFIDYLNLNKYSLNLFQKIKLRKVLVVSKVDVLRRDIKFSKITKWLEKEYHLTDDIIFLSTKTGYGVNSILNYISDTNTKTAYIIGITNAGKSTFLNHLLKNFNISKEILVSDKPNTTLDFIPLHINNIKIYDTPGLTYPNMHTKIIQKEIKPITFNLKKPTTINIPNYSLTFLYPTSITCYFNTSDIKRTYNQIAGQELSIGNNQDLVIPGLGFINVKKSGTIIINNSENIEIRNSLSGDNYE